MSNSTVIICFSFSFTFHILLCLGCNFKKLPVKVFFFFTKFFGAYLFSLFKKKDAVSTQQTLEICLMLKRGIPCLPLSKTMKLGPGGKDLL